MKTGTRTHAVGVRYDHSVLLMDEDRRCATSFTPPEARALAAGLIRAAGHVEARRRGLSPG